MSKTPKGKAKSRLNAIKHGLRATDDLFLESLAPQERAIHNQIRHSLHEEYKPLSEREIHLVDRMAIHHLRLYRIYSLENRATAESQRAPLSRGSVIHHLDRLSRYDWRIERQLRMLHNRLYALYTSRGDHSLKLISRND